MKANQTYKSNMVIRFILLLLTTGLIIFCGINKYIYLVVVFALFLLWQIWSWYLLYTRILKEFNQFVEGVQYHDFSQNFHLQKQVGVFLDFRAGFNIINREFLSISKEKEKQYQYLQKILELVDTGILLFDTHSGNVVWMNEALKNILSVPFFKNIAAIERRYADLYYNMQMLTGKKGKIISFKKEKSVIQLQLSSSLFKVDDSEMKLIVFQNINEVVDVTESQAWNKLLRVLTHEIMNSVAPISSLAGTIQKGLTQEGKVDKEDLLLGIQTIKHRSEGLVRFAEAYRNLNKIEKPQLEAFYVRDIFETLDTLFEPTLSQANIELEIILPDIDLEITADRSLLDQALINLVLNAMDAVKDRPNPCIQLYANQTDNNIEIKVIDNGKGMNEAIQERIFIPFFSTKGSGSGIGLSLCKQIVLLHGGSIRVHSIEGQGTQFILTM